MEQAEDRATQLREQAAAVRIRIIESNRATAQELAAIWRELNALAPAQPGLRRTCDRIAGDIALLEKLDLALDVEWLDESRHTKPDPVRE